MEDGRILREQFTFYRSYYEALKELPKRDQVQVILAICAYALDEEEPVLSGVPLSVFTLIRPTLDAGRNKAKNRMNKRGTNQKQTGNKTEQTRKEREGEEEKEKEGEREGEKESEDDSPPPVPPLKRGGSPEPETVLGEAVVVLPLNDGTEYPVLSGQVDKLAELYPAVDVAQQLRNMRGWLLANPSRRKTCRGVERFIHGWLAREQDRGGCRGGRSGPGSEGGGNVFLTMLREEGQDGQD